MKKNVEPINVFSSNSAYAYMPQIDSKPLLEHRAKPYSDHVTQQLTSQPIERQV